MEDAAFEARYADRTKRRRRTLIVGFTLLGLMALGLALVWCAPFIMAARESAQRRMLLQLEYPQAPSVPGVYPVTAEQARYFTDIILSTPAMPLAMNPEANAASARPFTLEVFSATEGRTRVEPADIVRVTIHGPPNTWRVHGGHELTLIADGKTLRVSTSMSEYHGDGWGLKEQDRLDFNVPTEFFVRVATAKTASGALDGEPFTIPPDEQAALRDFAAYLRPGIEIRPPK